MRLIDADVLLDKVIEHYCKDCNKRKGIKSGKWRVVYEIGDAPCRACGVGDVMDEIEDAPTIEPERKKGKWKLNKDGSGTCSECHMTQVAVWDWDNWQNFCGHCGADMRGE